MTTATKPDAERAIPPLARPLHVLGSGNVTHDLVNQLGHQIVGGGFGEGAILPNEGAMSSGLGISRTAVREAIKMLTAKGLVSSRLGAGPRCVPFPTGTCSIRTC